MSAPAELVGCLIAPVLMIGGASVVLVFFGNYGWWTFVGLALAIFGPQVVIPYWLDRKKRRERWDNSN